MNKLSEERTRRLEELRAKYRPKPEPRVVSFDIIKCWREVEIVGYQQHDDEYWQVLTGEVELVNGEVVRVWMAQELWLPLRCEFFDHCPPLTIPPAGYLESFPELG